MGTNNNVILDFNAERWEILNDKKNMLINSFTLFEDAERYCKRKGYIIESINENEETNNEVKRTQGEWMGKEFQVYNESGNTLAYCPRSNKISDEEAQANADFICEAVNNYSKLKKDNAALQKALSTLTGMHSNLKEDNALLLEALRWITQIDRNPDNYLKLVQIAKDAIQKVKK